MRKCLGNLKKVKRNYGVNMGEMSYLISVYMVSVIKY